MIVEQGKIENAAKVGDLAETLASGGSLMRIRPIWLLEWADLCKKAVCGWLDDHAATMGAAIAYYAQACCGVRAAPGRQRRATSIAENHTGYQLNRLLYRRGVKSTESSQFAVPQPRLPSWAEPRACSVPVVGGSAKYIGRSQRLTDKRDWPRE